MIEFRQPIQCLFCPQRRKIALIMKILLALSTAIIMGLLLFPPRLKPSQSHPDSLLKGNDSYNALPVGDSSHEPLQKANPSAGQVSEVSKEIWIRAQKRSQ